VGFIYFEMWREKIGFVLIHGIYQLELTTPFKRPELIESLIIIRDKLKRRYVPRPRKVA